MNEILHSITNLAGGWPSRAFPATSAFVPAPPDQVLDALRSAVMLTPGAPLFYLVGAMGIIGAVPEVRHQFGEVTRSYDPALYVPPPDQFVGGVLRSNRHGPPLLNRTPTEWPVRMDIKLTCLDDQAALLEYGSTSQTVWAHAGAGHLSVEWPAGAGVSGRIELATTWEAGAVVSIWHEPGHFPVEAMLARLIQMESFHVLMGASQLASSFYQTSDPVERAALFYLALGRANRAIYP